MQLEANITFPHHRLDVYRLSLEALDATAALVQRVPRGYGYATNQLRRAALSTVLAIAEGASRRTTRDKPFTFTFSFTFTRASGERIGRCRTVKQEPRVLTSPSPGSPPDPCGQSPLDRPGRVHM